MEETDVIDWSSDETHLLLNPRLPADERARLEALASALTRPFGPPSPASGRGPLTRDPSPRAAGRGWRVAPGEGRLAAHVLLETSGTSGPTKLVALSKKAILASAAAVNERLEATAADAWCCVLPEFHVGGLGIHARAHLSGSRVITISWDPQRFAATDATLASLVPAQVHDLVAAGLRPPRSLRAILVGGGAFDPQLDDRARSLGWPVLPTYGMSECCSTVSVCDVLLSHLQARREDDGRLAFRGASLFTGYATDSGFVDPKAGGWFISDDLGDVDGRIVRVRGRRGDFLKIGGESVDLARLDRILDEVRGMVDAALIPVPDERLGQVIHLAATSDATELVESFNARVLPFERIRDVHRVNSIPRSSLGKLLRAQLIESMVGSKFEVRSSNEE